MGHIKPWFFPTQKEQREPLHCVARHYDPVLKQVARETWETLAIKFSGPSQESVSSRPSIHGWETTEERPHADRRRERKRERVCGCLWVCVVVCAWVQ